MTISPEALEKARAVVAAWLQDERTPPGVRMIAGYKPKALVEHIASALAAKDAEIAALKKEAADVVRPFAWVADTEDEVGREDPEDDRVWVVQAHGCQIGDLTIEDFRAARSFLDKMEGRNG